MSDQYLPQGDVRLLDHPVAQRLLHSSELARIAYIAPNGTPRIDPMLFSWNGQELLIFTSHTSRKVAYLREKPDVAIVIDVNAATPESVQIRGKADITIIQGLPPEFLDTHRRYGGDAQVAAVRAQMEGRVESMARIAVRPAWVGVLDFQTRLPAVVA